MAEEAVKISVPYFDLTRQRRELSSQLETVLKDVLESGQYVLSSAVRDFENAFARFCGSPYAVGVGSGTDALIFALKACGIEKGDEVVVPSFTFIASAFGISHAGARPVFADVDPRTYTLDPASVEKVLTRRTRAILPVHLYGQAADMEPLLALAKEKKLKVIEDACQAHGALWKNKKAGTLGDAGCFSFYPTKNLGAIGDGGMVLTSKASRAESVRRLGNLGRTSLKDPHWEFGWTSRLDALQAGVLSVKLKFLDSFNEKRRKIAERYKKNLKDTPLVLPYEREDGRHVYHLFVVRVPNRRRGPLQKFLQEEGVPTRVHYPQPIHRQPPYLEFAKALKRLPVTEMLAKEILSLPIFPEMKEEEIDRVCEVIRRFYGMG